MPPLPPVTRADLAEMSKRPFIGGYYGGSKATGTTNTASEMVESGAGSPMAAIEGTAWAREVKARLIARDPAALTEMYDQFGSYVFGLAARVIGDRRAAEDVTQDVFLSLWERPDAFDPERGRLRTFVGTLAHRRAIDLVRREEARRRRTARGAATLAPISSVADAAV